MLTSNYRTTVIIHWEMSLNEYKQVNVMQGIKLLTVPCFYQETSPENSNTFTDVIYTVCFKGLKLNVEICRCLFIESETFTDTEMCTLFFLNSCLMRTFGRCGALSDAAGLTP